MEKYKLQHNITYENYSEILKKTAQNISNIPKVELDLENVRLNSAAKAFIREITVLFPDKIVIDKKWEKEVFYQSEPEFTQNNIKREDDFLLQTGNLVIARYEKVRFFLIIFVDMLYYSIQSLYNKKDLLKNDTLKNSFYIGWKAIPIVSLLSFLIGFTITVQAAVQMAKFGGQGFLAMLIGLAMFKELGPLITAIIISGRTGSSIAAEIGTMVVMEEIDALTTMGVKPLKFILVPRFWAFTLSMPILTLISDFAGVGGGLLVSVAYNVPPSSFINQLIDVLKMRDVFWGAVKSLSFAWVILAVASYKGLNVRGGADAVGRATTESVVVSIFMVVIIDAIFSIFLYM